MPVKPVLLYTEDEEKLRTPSQKVQKVNKRVRQLITDLIDTLETKPGAGLAAPQIGVHQRVTVVQFGQDDEEEGIQPPIALINPEILEAGPVDKGFDGCLSMPGVVTWDTLRPTWLRFSALDEYGNPFEMRVEGIDAILVHHEIDHLDGIFFLDRLTEDGELFMVVSTPEGEKLMPLQHNR